jgi:hypothetical protein
MLSVNRPELAGRTARRSALATVEIITLACGAHVVAGGDLPAPGFVLALAAVIFGASLLTFGQMVRLRYVVPVVFLAQVGLHERFDGGAVMSMHAIAGPANGSVQPPLTQVFPMMVSPLMLWAHLVISVITAIVLFNQERVLAAVVNWLISLVPSPYAGQGLGRSVAGVIDVLGVREHLIAAAPRRGPPLAFAVPA